MDCTALTAAVSTPPPQIGELLYPGFNSIVPHFVEHVLPNMTSQLLNDKEACMLVSAFYQLLDFAFRTQIFRQAQINVAKASNFATSGQNTLQNLLASNQSIIDDVSAAQYKPMQLEFAPRSKHFHGKKGSKHTTAAA